MKKRFRLFLVFGFVLGFLAIALFWVQRYLVAELIDVLEDEASKACDCSFSVEKMSLSLLTLSARASNARIDSPDGSSLVFERAYVTFSIRNILEREVILTRLDLIDGRVNGIGEDSATFKFIDHLTEAPSPDSESSGLLKAKLHNLNISNTSFVEEFTNSRLLGSGVHLSLSKDEKDDFLLHPLIESLDLELYSDEEGEPSRMLALGEISGTLIIEPDGINFQQVQSKLNESFLEIEAFFTNSNRELGGSLKHNLLSTSLDLPEWLSFDLSGEGTVAGTIARPEFEIDFSNRTPLSISPENFPSLKFDSVTGKFDLEISDDNDLKADVTALSGVNSDTNLRLIKPIQIEGDKISGAVQLNMGSLSYEDYTFKNLGLNISVNGTFDKLGLTVRGSAGRSEIEGLVLESLDLDLSETQEGYALQVSHSSNARGTMEAKAQLINVQEQTILSGGSFKAVNFQILEPGSASETFTNLRINAEGAFDGPADIQKLNLNSSLEVLATDLPEEVKGGFTLQNGKFELHLLDQSKAASLKLATTLSDAMPSTLEVKLKDYTLDEEYECLSSTLNLNYNFSITEPMLGSGQINIKNLHAGCNSTTVKIQDDSLIPIKNGVLLFPELILTGKDTEGMITGSIDLTRGYNLELKGAMELQFLLLFAPILDDLRGLVEVVANVTGELASPLVSGEAVLKDGELSLEAQNVSVRDMQGRVRLSSEKLTIEHLEGFLNGGTFNLAGDFILEEPEQSQFNLNFSEVLLEPIENTILILSGDLNLAHNHQNIPGIQGRIHVDSGEFQRNLDFTTLLRGLVDLVFSPSESQAVAEQLPNIALDVRIDASRNLFIFTNLLGAELKADVHVSGSFASPIVAGRMETLSGWFGLQDRRFEITSGSIFLRPGVAEPVLELVSETEVMSPMGDSILVILDASGPISSPMVNLTSDRDLSQAQILDLLTGVSEFSGQSAVAGATRLMDLDSFSLLDEDTPFQLGRLFRDITTLDSLALEPTYNMQSGNIEPTLIATKHLTESLSLVGESYLGGEDNESRFTLNYSFIPAIRFSGTMDTISSEENLVLGANVTYTILAKQRTFLELKLYGNRAIRRHEVLKNVRLNEASRIPVNEVPKIKDSILSFYKSRGYYSTQVKVTCQESDTYCRRMTIETTEGPASMVQKIVLRGDSLEPILDTAPILSVADNTRAEKRFLNKKRNDLIRSLRAEGYIGARVDARYQSAVSTNGEPGKDLVIESSIGRPVSFIFRGNSTFNSEELLQTINLLNRQQPFGLNTINILLENIVKKYHEAGYLNVEISHRTEDAPTSDRVSYYITIDEGAPVRVSRVVFEGNEHLSESMIADLLTKHGITARQRLLSPRAIVTEELDTLTSVIRRIYIEEGFPEAEVRYEVVLGDNPQTAEIHYTISEGREVRADWLNIEGLPDNFRLAEPPEAPYSVSKANKYIDLLIYNLRQHGYFSPSVSSDFDFENQRLTLVVDPGEPTTVESISLEGNFNIKDHVVYQHLLLKPGDNWNEHKMIESRRRLLRLGLFSRVDFSPSVSEVKGERQPLKVRLVERPLRTLEVGGGLNSEYGVRLFGEATDKALFSDGKTLSLRTDTFYDPAEHDITKGLAALRFSNPSIFGSRLSLTEDFRYQKVNLSTQEFDLDRISLGSYLSRSTLAGLSYTFGHTYLTESLDDVSAGAILSPLDEGRLDLSYLSGTLAFDRRNNALNPRSGYTLNFDYLLASEALASDANFYSLGGRFSYLYPLNMFNQRFTLAANSRVASAWTFGGTSNVPISHRFYLGGRKSIRGFRENSLGPRGEDGSVIGGDLLFANNLELRYHIGENFALHTFFDAGTVYLQDRSVSAGDLRTSTGIGFRYLSPIGPIGFDVGAPLDERAGEPSVRLHFVIGNTF